MKFEDIPTHTPEKVLLSRQGRINVYAEYELGKLHRELVFSQMQDDKELIKRLQTIIDNINKIPNNYNQ